MDDIEIIRGARQQHQGILEILRTLADAPSDLDDEVYRAVWLSHQVDLAQQESDTFIGDREALYQLELQRLGASGGLTEEDRRRSVAAFQHLATGLERHFSYEEGAVADALRRHGGDMFVAQLAVEHKRIRALISALIDQIATGNREAETSERRLAADASLYASLRQLRLTIETHAQREEVIFDMAERAIALGG